MVVDLYEKRLRYGGEFDGGFVLGFVRGVGGVLVAVVCCRVLTTGMVIWLAMTLARQARTETAAAAKGN